MKNWIEGWTEFTRGMRLELADKDPDKQDSWKDMRRDELISDASRHIKMFLDSGETHPDELIHAANYLMMAWASIEQRIKELDI